MKRLNKVIYFFLVITFIIGVLNSCSRKDPKFLTEKYVYDNNGKIVSYTSAEGQITQYTYNEQKLPIEIKYKGGSTTFGYDANGNRSWMKDSRGISKYFYDAFDRLVGFISTYNPKKIITYGYDSWGYLVDMAIYDIDKMALDPRYKEYFPKMDEDADEDLTNWKRQEDWFGKIINQVETDNQNSLQKIQEYHVCYNHDIWGNLTRIDTKEGSIAFFYFPDLNQVIRQLPNGIKTTYTYSTEGYIKSIIHSDNQRQFFIKYEYSYDAARKVIKVTEESKEEKKSTEYFWDKRGYLVELKHSNGNSYKYTYDEMGNRLSQGNGSEEFNYSYDGYGRLVKAGDVRLKWNTNGQLTSETNSSADANYRYDGRKLPILIKTNDATFGYKWNGDANLISQQKKRDLTYYLPDPLSSGGNILGEYDSKGNIKSLFLYGGGFIGSVSNTHNISYFLEDGFNSIRTVTNSKGDIISQFDFTPFGEPFAFKGNLPCEYRCTGEKYLPDIRKYLIGNRLYDPCTGRYLSPDPDPGYLERMDSYNQYTHGDPDPLNFMEPRCNQTMHKQSFFQALNNGSFFGTRFGEQALNYYANKWAETDNPLYAIPGGLSALWTPQTWKSASLTLLTPFAGKFIIEPLIAKGASAGSFAEPFHLKMIPFKPLENLVHYGINKFGPHIGLGFGSKSIIHIYSNYIRFGNARNGVNLFADLPKVFMGLSALTEPVKSLGNQLGGISLDATAHFTGNIGSIKSVVYNKEKQCVILIGDGNKLVTGMKPDDLAIAIKSVYQNPSCDLQFSLDPADRSNPDGPWLKAVYYPEELTRGTSVGDAMFKADWLLKQYSFGVSIDSGGKMTSRNCFVPGFKNIADLSLEMKDENQQKLTRNRLWIVAKELDDDKQYNMLLNLTSDGNAIYFEIAKMAVKVKQQVVDPSSPTGLRDIEVNDPVATKFAELFSESYDQIALESPDFERVRDIAKAVAMAKWLKKQQIPVDMSWVDELTNKKGEYTDKVPSLSVQWKKQETKVLPNENGESILTQTNKIRLFGGVNGAVNPKMVPDKGSLDKFKETLSKKIETEGRNPVYNIEYNGKVYRAVISPVTKSGREIIENMHVTEDNGALYYFNNQKEITRIVDEAGNKTDISYNTDHSVQSYQTTFINHWKSSGEKTQYGSRHIITNPRGYTFQYDYSSDGLLKEVLVNGKPFMNYDHNDQLGQTTITRNEGQEIIRYNKRRKITSYEFKPKQSSPLNPKPIESVLIAYNNKDQIEKIEGTGLPATTISYGKEGQQPEKISVPTGQVNYTYDAAGRPTEISNLTGSSSVTYKYKGDAIESVQFKSGEKSSEYTFNENGIEQILDFSGNRTEITRSKNGDKINVKDGAGKGEIHLEQNKRKINLPNGEGREFLLRKLEEIEKMQKAPFFEFQFKKYPSPNPVRSPLQKIFWWRLFTLWN